jgi:hypothetical protein
MPGLEQLLAGARATGHEHLGIPTAGAGSAEQAAGLEFSAILGLPGAVKLGKAGDLGR